jgi:hypothetical protein
MSSVTPSARIPFDVHLMILEHCSFRTAQTYALVSKATAPAASRCLYRDLHWGPSGDVYAWSCNTIQKLLRTLVNRPELALLVKTVDFDVEYRYEFDSEGTYLAKQRIYPANPRSVKLATKLVQKLGLPEADYWNYALAHTSLDPWIAILLSQLTSIEELTLGPPLLHKSTHIGRMFHHVIHSEPLRYGRLRRVHFADPMAWNYSAGLYFGSELYMPLFHLPSLKELNLTLNTPNFIPPETACGSRLLKTIRILRSRMITPETMTNLSKSASYLETLHLDWSVFNEEGEYTVGCARVGSAIAEIQALKRRSLDGSKTSGPLHEPDTRVTVCTQTTPLQQHTRASRNPLSSPTTPLERAKAPTCSLLQLNHSMPRPRSPATSLRT